MPRTRYRFNTQTQQLEEVGSDWTDAPRSTGDLGKFEYDNLRTTDGADISSRTKRNRYMKEKGLADPRDFSETWKKAEAERIAHREGQLSNPERRAVIGRIAYELEKRRK